MKKSKKLPKFEKIQNGQNQKKKFEVQKVGKFEVQNIGKKTKNGKNLKIMFKNGQKL